MSDPTPGERTKVCTCMGVCRGKEGLGRFWHCALEEPRPVTYRAHDARAVAASPPAGGPRAVGDGAIVTMISAAFRVVSGALQGDPAKVRNYAKVMADAIERHGDSVTATRLLDLLAQPGAVVHAASEAHLHELREMIARNLGARYLTIFDGVYAAAPRGEAGGPSEAEIEGILHHLEAACYVEEVRVLRAALRAAAPAPVGEPEPDTTLLQCASSGLHIWIGALQDIDWSDAEAARKEVARATEAMLDEVQNIEDFIGLRIVQSAPVGEPEADNG